MIGNNFYNIGYDSPHFKQNGGFSPEALAWENNIIGNGGTITKEKLKFFDDYFFKPAKAATRILDELDRLNIYCNLLGFPIAARTNMINSNHFVTPVSSPTFDNNGYRSSGTSYLNLNYIPSTQAVKFARNSASIGAVVKNPDSTTQHRIMGATGSLNRTLSLGRLATPSLAALVNCSNITGITTLITSSVGNIIFEGFRDNSTQASAVINGVGSPQTQTSLPLNDVTQFELTQNNNGTPFATGYDLSSHLCSWHGSGALDRVALRTILNNLFTAAGI
jgi:hypothetical protein